MITKLISPKKEKINVDKLNCTQYNYIKSILRQTTCINRMQLNRSRRELIAAERIFLNIII